MIATPPCQGMSVANHNKNNETARNSLVVQSIMMINKIRPKVAVFENVRAFLKTACTDIDGTLKPIGDAITQNLTDYHIYSEIINFKDYGSPSQRTRTIVICTRKDLLHSAHPAQIMPDRRDEKTIRQVIGRMPPLCDMGEIDQSDIFHFYRRYDEKMLSWIRDLKEGESAFDNTDADKIPHTIRDGVARMNQNKNGDKYKRCFWDKPMCCIHTRNDILSSQMTIHPRDNRVFSVRELMMLMGMPNNFKWSDIPESKLNMYSFEDKIQFLKKNELNIRKCIGESVPTVIFEQMARKIQHFIRMQ